MNPKSPPSLTQDEGVGTAPLPHPGSHFQISPSEIIMGARTPHKTRSPTLFVSLELAIFSFIICN